MSEKLNRKPRRTIRKHYTHHHGERTALACGGHLAPEMSVVRTLQQLEKSENPCPLCVRVVKSKKD